MENKEELEKDKSSKDNIEEKNIDMPEEVNSLEEGKESGKASAVPQLDFIKEQTKERPLNKRKLLRRTFITALMAVVFGIVACVTLVLLEPVITNYFNPAPPPEPVRLPPETQEILPEDMAYDDDDLDKVQDGGTLYEGSMPGDEKDSDRKGAENTASGKDSDGKISDKTATGQNESGKKASDKKEPGNGDSKESQDGEVDGSIITDPLGSYKDSYSALQSLCDEISSGLVTITTISSDTSWLEGSFETSRQTTGAVVADTTKYILVLAKTAPLQKAERMTVTFRNGTVAEAAIRMSDPGTGISILEASKEGLDATALVNVKAAELGNSNSSSIKGGPVIALGNPMGISSSVCYGVITSTGTPLQAVDSRYRIITTDIYGSQSATGFLANLQGQIIGVIDQSYNDPDVKNMISALGISELRQTIERLSNNKKQAYLGIYTDDVSIQIAESRGIPTGAFITGVKMDSPAMTAGIQSGDVLVRINSTRLTSQADYINALSNIEPGSEVTLAIMREGREGFIELTMDVVLADVDDV